MSQRKWKIDRIGHRWTDDEIERQINSRPHVSDWMTWVNKESRLYSLLGLVLENLGIDRVIRLGNLEDWEAAVGELKRERAPSDSDPLHSAPQMRLVLSQTQFHR